MVSIAYYIVSIAYYIVSIAYYMASIVYYMSHSNLCSFMCSFSSEMC